QQTVSFTIVQTTNGAAVLTIVPATATITAAYNNMCSTGFHVDYYIYGGTPPYRVTSSFPDGVVIVNPVVTTSGGFFEAITNGACVHPLPSSIFAAVGLQTTAPLINQPGTAAPPTAPPPPALTISPSSVSLTETSAGSGCNAGFVIAGGTPPYNY